jgi:large subunit ribosomal protein L24
MDLRAADATDVIAGDPRPILGRGTLRIELEGSGLSPAAFIGSLAGTGTVVLEGTQIAGLDAKAFEKVIEAVDRGLDLDAGKIRDVAVGALNVGRLNLPEAEGAIVISNGRVRISLEAPAERADLAISGGLDLADGALDLRLALTGPPKPPATQRPTVSVLLKGPVGAPKRSVDVAALVNWLTLRAVDQQAKHLEAIEVDRRERDAATTPIPPDVPPVRVAPESPPPAAGAPASGSAGSIPSPSSAVSTPERTRPIGGGAAKPVTRTKEPARPRASQQPVTTVQPPTVRSFFDRLFGAQD